MNILVALYVILFIVLTKIRFELALLVLVIALPSYLIKFSLFGIPATILEAMILVVFASWLIDNWKEQWNYLKLACSKNGQSLKVSYPFSREIIALLIFSFISVGIAEFSLQSLGLWKAYFFEPILLFIVLINIYGKKNYKIEGLVNALAVSAICVGGFAIIQKYTNIGWSAEWIAQNRVTSIYSYPNAIGLYLGPIILILVGQLVGHFKQGVKFKDNLIRSAGYSTTIIISLVAIILAKSDGAMLGVSVGLLFFGLFVNKQVRWVILSFIILGSISLYSLQANNQAIAQKLRLQDLSGSIRLIIWNETALLLKDNHWLLGVGLGEYQKAVKPYHVDGFFFNKDNDPDFQRKIVIFNEKYKAPYWQPLEIYLYPHNILLNSWVELGLFGAIAFFVLMVRFMQTGFNYFRQNEIDKYLVLGLLASMIVILVHGLVDVPYFKNDLASLFWITFALMGLIKLKKDL